MRARLGIVCLLLATTACGPGQPVAADGEPPLDLPVVAECGSIPTGPSIVTVRIPKDGSIHVPGVDGPMSLRGLQRHLAAKRQQARPREPSERSDPLGVVLEVDAFIPWKLVAWLLKALRHPFIELRHSWFAVRHADDLREGAVAFVWGGDFGINPDTFSEEGMDLGVHLRPAAGHPDLEGLYERTRRIDERALEKAIVRVRPPKDAASVATWGDLLGVLDALHGGGARRLRDLPHGGATGLDWATPRVWADDPPEEALLEAQRRWVREHRQARPGVTIVINGETLPALSTPRPRTAGPRHPGTWGWTGDNEAVGYGEDDDDLLFEDVEDPEVLEEDDLRGR